MKKTILILAILLSSITATAQEKQNDATWEETIAFLKDNLPSLNGEQTLHFYNYKIEGDKLIHLRMRKKDRGEGHSYHFSANLNKLKKVELDNDTPKSYIRCYFKGNHVVQRNYNTKKIMNYGDYFPIIMFNKDEGIRILKAFKHLAYLANEKRKQSKF